MKEELKESPLKPQYDDAVLEGSMEDALLTRRYQVVKRIDGFSALNFGIGFDAKKLGEKRGCDGAVAKGIAFAILDSLVIYGDIGKKFLSEKMQESGETFSQEEYSKDVARSITAGYQYARKQKIIEGIVDAMHDNPENLEANAAKSALMANEYYNEDRYDEGREIKKRFLEGKYVDYGKIIKRLEQMHYKTVSEEQAYKNLNIAYNYFQKNYNMVSENFRKEFPGISKNKMICYRIANLDDGEMEKVLKFAKEEKDKEER